MLAIMAPQQQSHTPLRLLIVDDEEAARYGMRRALSNFDYAIAEAESVADARTKLSREPADLLLLDVNLPGTSGLDYLRELKSQDGSPLVVILTAHGSERTAVEAIKSGAHDYLAKPFEVDELRLIVRNALETVRLRRENERLRETIARETGKGDGTFIGESKAMMRVRAMIEKVAETDATVLVRGESGTGKELVARAIHERSLTRRKGAFVAVNCAALPSELIESELFGHEKGAFTGASARRHGKFEQADGGTLFLDEIGDMSANVQAKLLRALEERRIERLGGNETIGVDVRIISATHRPLEQEIAAGNFRSDLFYRLRVVEIEIPPLRERREDIPALARAFAALSAARYNIESKTLSPAVLRRLIEYDWPGNVRELRNTIERAVVLAEGEELTPRDLPEEINAKATDAKTKQTISETPDALDVPFTGDFREDRREFERRYIARCLDDAGGNVTRAAAQLGMHRQSLQHKLRELGLARRYISIEAQE
jgi:DNA-binding NtrC family response regulator